MDAIGREGREIDTETNEWIQRRMNGQFESKVNALAFVCYRFGVLPRGFLLPFMEKSHRELGIQNGA